jgi:hypothetical protein
VPGEDSLAVGERDGARLREREQLGDRARCALRGQAAAEVWQHHGGGVQRGLHRVSLARDHARRPEQARAG